MPLESASYINSLVATNPTSTDTVSQADDHIRLIKKVLKDTFPNLNAPVTATPSELNSAVPTGFIGMWSGSVATIPTGWALCDGSSGRPDLRDRFIVGAGSTYTVGTTGGANSVVLTESNLPAHNHSFSGSGTASNSGAHTHPITDTGHSHVMHGEGPTPGGGYLSNNNSLYSGGGASYFGVTASPDTDMKTGTSVTGISVNSAGAHTHSITVTGVVGSSGSGVAHENRPPYYALAFIIKL